MSIYNPFSLDGKTILVTGASSGIGKATAIECSKMGATVVITGRDKERLNETFHLLNGEGHKVISADLSEKDGINQLIENTPTLNGIVHAAGIAMPLPFNFVNKEKMLSIFEINFFAPTTISQQLLKMRKIAKGSSVVFIASVSGIYRSYQGGSLYSATKGAINGLVKGMALDLAPKKIRVNCISPAMVQSSILSSGVISEDQLQEDMKKYPLKRYGTPLDIAYASIYLLSDASEWITGTSLLIDGGITLQ